MADATIIIDGGIVADPRQNTVGENRVGNLTVRAGRSKKNDQGGYDTLSSTAYDVACWNEVHDLLAAQTPEKGSQVRITGTVSGVRTYVDKEGATQATVEVRAEGVKVWPKRNQSGGYQQQAPQQSYAPQQGYGAPQQQSAWPTAAQPGQGFDQPPF